MKLPKSFYAREDVVAISKELLGKYLFTKINGTVTGGIISETEAYAGAIDRASHAYNNRRTARTEIMYSKGGTAYIYLCYGIHHLFNVVTNAKGIPHAILIRAIYPVVGTKVMLKRRKKETADLKFTIGPGSMSEALGIKVDLSGTSLSGNKIWIEDRKLVIPDNIVLSGPRIGVDYAGKDALLPYRFRVLHSILEKLI